jgi:hypothetical protein
MAWQREDRAVRGPAESHLALWVQDASAQPLFVTGDRPEG